MTVYGRNRKPLTQEEIAKLAVMNPVARRHVLIQLEKDGTIKPNNVAPIVCPRCENTGTVMIQEHKGAGFYVVPYCDRDSGGCGRVSKQMKRIRDRRCEPATVKGHDGGKGGAPR